MYNQKGKKRHHILEPLVGLLDAKMEALTLAVLFAYDVDLQHLGHNFDSDLPSEVMKVHER